MVINRIGPLSCAKIAGTLYFFLGLVIGAAFSLVALAGGFATDTPEMGVMGALIGVGSIIFIPLLYGCIGFFSALIGAWLYNLMAGFVGGLQLDVQ
jgi:hypothetical protein